MKVKPEFPANPCLMQRVGDSEYRPNKPGAPTEYIVSHGGMSIRTELAARAMQGFASNSYWGKTMEWEEYRDRLVKASVDLADSLIKELNKPTE